MCFSCARRRKPAQRRVGHPARAGLDRSTGFIDRQRQRAFTGAGDQLRSPEAWSFGVTCSALALDPSSQEISHLPQVSKTPSYMFTRSLYVIFRVTPYVTLEPADTSYCRQTGRYMIPAFSSAVSSDLSRTHCSWKVTGRVNAGGEEALPVETKAIFWMVSPDPREQNHHTQRVHLCLPSPFVITVCITI